MHQTRKGNEWHFGMKAHIGVDAETGLVHGVRATPANTHDLRDKVISIDAKVIKVISPEVAYKHLMLPLRKQGARLTVAMTNPSDLRRNDDLRASLGIL